eukprot:1538129-Amphidinium_carterae.1
MLAEEGDSPLAVRVDAPMDRRVAVVPEVPEAVATQLPAEEADLDMVAPSYKVGPHLCRLTAGDT